MSNVIKKSYLQIYKQIHIHIYESTCRRIYKSTNLQVDVQYKKTLIIKGYCRSCRHIYTSTNLQVDVSTYLHVYKQTCRYENDFSPTKQGFTKKKQYSTFNSIHSKIKTEYKKSPVDANLRDTYNRISFMCLLYQPLFELAIIGLF